jgi:Glucanosyltransferase
MQRFQDAGIYVMVQLTGMSEKVFKVDSNNQVYWDYTVYQLFEREIDAFQQYNNTLGFFFLLEDFSEDLVEAFTSKIKAAVRDIRGYMKIKNYRSIPIGVEGQNHANPSIAEFMSCSYEDSAIDFLSLSLVDLTTVSNSSQQQKNDTAKHCLDSLAIQDQVIGVYNDYPVPIILHYGCPGMITGEHNFEEIQLIANHTNHFSGQIIDYWFSNSNSGYLDQGKCLLYSL